MSVVLFFYNQRSLELQRFLFTKSTQFSILLLLKYLILLELLQLLAVFGISPSPGHVTKR